MPASSGPKTACRDGLARLDEIRERARSLEVRPDIAGFADLAMRSTCAARCSPRRRHCECALERRETRGAHNRADFPSQDPLLQVNLDWTSDGVLTHRPISPPSARVSALAAGSDLESTGRLLE